MLVSRRRSIVCAALCGLALTSTPSVHAGDPAPARPPVLAPARDAAKEAAAAAMAAFRARVNSWMDARRRLVVECSTCRGTGRVLYETRREYLWQKCARCNGHGRRFDEARARVVLVEMRSPSWRARPEAEQEWRDVLDSWKVTDEARIAPKAQRLEKVEAVDATHLIAYVTNGADPAPTAYRWMRDPDTAPTTKESWYLWTEGVDAWPTPEDVERRRVEERSESLRPDLDAAVTALIAKVGPTAKCTGRRRLDSDLLLAFDFPVEQENVDGYAARDAYMLLRPLFAMSAEWSSVRLTFRAWWQDKFGEREIANYLTIALDRATANRIRWENLDVVGVWNLLDTKRETREGWTVLGK